MTKRIWMVGLISLALALSACGKIKKDTASGGDKSKTPPVEETKKTDTTVVKPVAYLEIHTDLKPSDGMQYWGIFFAHKTGDLTPVALSEITDGEAKVQLKVRNEIDHTDAIAILSPTKDTTTGKATETFGMEKLIQFSKTNVFQPFSVRMGNETSNLKPAFKLAEETVIALPRAAFAVKKGEVKEKEEPTPNQVAQSEVIISKAKKQMTISIWSTPPIADEKILKADKEDCRIVVRDSKGKVSKQEVALTTTVDLDKNTISLKDDEGNLASLNAGTTTDAVIECFFSAPGLAKVATGESVDVSALVATHIGKLTISDK